MKAPKCRVCGCTDECACAEGCEWVEYDLCSACVPKLDEALRAVIYWEACQQLVRQSRWTMDDARNLVIDKLRVLPRGLRLGGSVYSANPARREIRIRKLYPKGARKRSH